MSKMKENPIVLPPIWCASICRNAMSEVCIEHCAIKKDTAHFKVRPELKLTEMPKFPDPAGMTREERFTAVVVYLSKITSHLQGAENDDTYIVRRPHPHRSSSRRLSPVVQVKNLLPDLTQAVPPLQDTEERKGERVRSEELAQSAD